MHASRILSYLNDTNFDISSFVEMHYQAVLKRYVH